MSDLKYGSISLNGPLVASMTLEAFKKSNIRSQFEEHYRGGEQDKVDENMEIAHKKCVAAFPDSVPAIASVTPPAAPSEVSKPAKGKENP